MSKIISLSGTFKVTQWDEQKADDNKNTGIVKYAFTSEVNFKGSAVYTFLYLKQNPGNPMESHSNYNGYLSVELPIDGNHVTVHLKDEGEFVNGKATSVLTVVGSDKYSGGGSYEASHDESRFELNIVG